VSMCAVRFHQAIDVTVANAVVYVLAFNCNAIESCVQVASQNVFSLLDMYAISATFCSFSSSASK